MKDIHSKIILIRKMFSNGCSMNCISHYYLGHSHFEGGIDMTFQVNTMTTKFFIGLQQNFENFNIRSDRGNIDVVIRVFNDIDMPF